jgi:rRNA-processing protein FCF1
MLTRSFLIGLFTLASATNIFAQKEKIQSVYVYNFISKYVEWPASERSGDFVIGVLGNSLILDEFRELAKTRMVGNQKIVAVKFNSAADITKCHVLFVAKSKLDEIDAAAGKIGNTLVITDDEQGIKENVAINFILVDNKQKFEYKPASAKSRGLIVSPELAKIAVNSN